MRVALPLLCLIAAPLAAQQSPDSTRGTKVTEIVVTAERRPTSASGTASAVRVISVEALRAKAAADLPTLLRELPGIQLDPVVGSGNGISLQGLGSDRVAVLLDGAPIAGRLSNEFDLTRIAPAQIERIEVLEGPQSTLYGSSALGGVINLITRAPTARRVELRSQGGSYGQLEFGGRLSGLLGASAMSLDLGRRSGDVAPGTALNTPGSVARWDGMARVLSPVGKGMLDVRAIHLREDQDYRSGSAASRSQSRNHNLQSDLLAAFTRGSLTLRGHLSAYDHTLSRTTLASGTETVEPQTQRTVDVEALNQVAVGRHTLVLGAQAAREWTRSERLAGGERDQVSGALYGSDEWRIHPAFALTGGARLSVAEQWGSDLAPRIGAVWNSGHLYAKAALARGFRAPSFNEQFADFLNSRAFYAVRGNAALTPESSWNTTGEIGVRATGAKAWVRAFHNRLRDFIETEAVGQEGAVTVFSYRNVGRARTAGVEVGGDFSHRALQLEAAYAYLDARNSETDQALLGQARHNARLAATWRAPHWQLTAEGVRTAAVPLSESSAGVVTWQGAARRVNLRGGLDLAHAWRLTAGVDNIGDVVPVNAISGFGRRVFAGASFGGSW